MLNLKDFIVYTLLSLLTFSGIFLSAESNFGRFFSFELLPQFTLSNKTEFGTYYKKLNSTHCIENVGNAGGNFEIIVSPKYFKVYAIYPNQTVLFEIDNLKTRITTKHPGISCEKIEDENGWIVKAKNKYGSLKFGFINGSYYEEVEGMINRLDWWSVGDMCRKILGNQTTLIKNVLNTSSCFIRQRIE